MPFLSAIALDFPKDLKVFKVLKVIKDFKVMLFSALRIRRHRPFVILVGESVCIRGFRVVPSGYLDRIRVFIAKTAFCCCAVFDFDFVVESYDATSAEKETHR